MRHHKYSYFYACDNMMKNDCCVSLKPTNCLLFNSDWYWMTRMHLLLLVHFNVPNVNNLKQHNYHFEFKCNLPVGNTKSCTSIIIHNFVRVKKFVEIKNQVTSAVKYQKFNDWYVQYAINEKIHQSAFTIPFENINQKSIRAFWNRFCLQLD